MLRPACAAVRGALAIGAVLVALAGAAPAAAQNNLAFASERFARGVDRYDARDFDGALEEFRASMALYASPNTRLYVARALRELGRLTEAWPEMAQTVREATELAATEPRYAATRDAARDELRELESRIGRVTLAIEDLPPDATVRVAGATIPPAAVGLAIPVMPGSVEIAVDAAGRPPIRRTVDVAAGDDRRVELAFPAPEERTPDAATDGGAGTTAPPARQTRSGTATTIGWIVLAAGGAALAIGGVLSLVTEEKHDDLAACDAAFDCVFSPTRAELADEGRSLATATHVMLGIGAGAVLGGVIVLLASGGDDAPDESPASVAILPGGAAVALGGRFP